MASQYDLPYTGPQVEALLAKISELESEMPSKTSDLTNDSGFITSSDVPTKTSDLNNDSGFITNAPVAAEAARAQAAEALLATISSLQAEITRATGVEGTLQDLIDGIAAKIPSAATEQNQLADKAFVNSSIATATAEFRGTYNSLAELQAVSADQNDYGYVRTTDEAGNTVFKRYKYASGSWVFEYDLNNSSFTASQWAAINSAITAELVEKLRALPTNAALTAALAAKQDVIEDLSSIRSKANSAYQKPSGGIPKTDLSQGVQDALDNAEGALTQNDIADNLTTDDPTKALSAKQGNVLDDKVSQLGQSIYGRERQETIVDLSQYPSINYTILSNNKWTKSTYYSKLIPVNPGQLYRFDKGDNAGVIAILTSNSVVAGTTPSYSSQYPSRITNIPDAIIIPSDGAYLYTVRETSSGAVTLQVYLVESERIVGLEERVDVNTGDIVELQDRFNAYYEQVIDVSTLTLYSEYISNNSWVLASESVQTRVSFVPVVGGRRYHLELNVALGSCRYVFLKTSAPGSGSAIADYAGDATETSLLENGETVYLLAPDDAVSLYIVRINSIGDNVTPNIYSVVSIEDAIDATNAEIDNIQHVIYHPIDLAQYTAQPFVLLTDGTFQHVTSTSPQSCLMVPITPESVYRVKANSSGGIIAVLTTTAYPGNNMPASFATGYTARIMLAASEEYVFVAPDDAHCLYLLRRDSSDTDRLPTYVKSSEIKTESSDSECAVSLHQIFDNIPVAIDTNGWEIPTTGGMVNALKKAEQACSIVYNAKSTYPTNSSDTGGAAGEHTGFPYSSTKQIRKYIGWEVSQRTFMTAVNNPYSLFYTENISSVRSKSGYGFTYSGVNCGSYYGMVCSIFAEWALGFKIPYETFNLAYLARIGKLVKIADQSAQGVHICDLLWQSGHTMLITGVQRDQYGNVINVITSESKSNVKATTRTAANFNSYLSTNNCIIYRPTEIYKNTEYVPSEFVAVRGESTPPAYVYNDDICFFAGDYAAWRLGDACWLNYTKGNYSSVKIYKGDTLVQTVSLDADGNVHKLDVTSYMDGAGKYKACMTDGTTDSDYTYWELVDTIVSYANGRVSFASTNGAPWWAQICSDTGVTFCFYEITAVDIANGYADVDFAQLIEDQEGNATGTTYLRVMFKADYGGVVSEMQAITY